MRKLKLSHIPVLLTFDLDEEVSTRLAAQVNGPGIDDPERGVMIHKNAIKLSLV